MEGTPRGRSGHASNPRLGNNAIDGMHRVLGAVSFATEGPFLNALGIETAVCGPGDIAQAHQPDEYVDGARWLSMQSIINALIAEYCLGG